MKKLLLALLITLTFISCKKETTDCSNKISICHRTSSSAKCSWITIEVNCNALPGHLAHGDVVPDADGDGYTQPNPCGAGTQNDCDDTNAAIHENCIATVTICNRVWMAKNLDVTKYRNGDAIPQIIDAAEWINLTAGGWCYYANATANGTVYGKLYNWYAVNDVRGLAPEGWHIPSDTEWNELLVCLGGYELAGGAMKETGLTHWNSPNTGATNSSGFTALPGGIRAGDTPLFANLGYEANWWSATENNELGLYRNTVHAAGNLGRNSAPKRSGISVRCIRN
ncbi:MAG: fibrobacter succinogenes major paralogous domain-containing protein [Bacteroidota bacterium]